MFPIFIVIFVSFLVQLNHTQFDFSKGESELVSGFNFKNGGEGFEFIFLGEYLRILLRRIILSLLFIFRKMKI